MNQRLILWSAIPAGVLAVLLVVLLVVWQIGPVVAPAEIVRATYVYEKDDQPPLPGVRLGLRRINAETEIEAGEIDDDATTPRFQVAIRAAAGSVPCLVLEYEDGTVKIVEVETAEDVWEAVQ